MAVTLGLMPEIRKKAKAVARAGVAMPLDGNGQYPSGRIPAIIKTLLDVLDDGDLQAVVRVYREAMTASRRYWEDEGRDDKGKCLGRWVTEPDHKVRIAAANMVAAYMEGLPVQRQIQMRGDFVELGDLIRTARQSGEAARLLNGLHSLPSAPERSE